MEIRLLGERDAEQIYHTYMEKDLPPSELKPFSSVQGLLCRGLYEPLALYEGGGPGRLRLADGAARLPRRAAGLLCVWCPAGGAAAWAPGRCGRWRRTTRPASRH